MTAAAADIQVDLKDGVEESFPVATATTIYGGTFVCVNAGGYALPGADTAALIFQGVATGYVANAGANGAKNVIVRRRGLVKATFATAISQANVGDNVFLADDNNVDVVANVSNAIFCGIVAKYIDTTHAWIDIEPAIRQADVATHVADTSAAHAASSISIADSGSLITGTTVETALAELAQHNKSAQKCVPIPLACLALEDGTPLAKFANGDSATPGFSQESNKEVVLRWNNHGTPTKVAVFGLSLPPDLDPAAAVAVHWRAKMSGANDTPVLEHECYLGAGDTDCAGTDDEIDGAATLTEYTSSIAHGDVGGSPEELTLIFGPKAGEIGTDDLLIYSVWLEYKGQTLTA